MDSQGPQAGIDPAAQPEQAFQVPPPPPIPSDPRFTAELEFVLSLGNPNYLSFLAVSYPYLLGTRDESADIDDGDDGKDGVSNENNEQRKSGDAAAFAAYLKYLYDYWRRPEYMQFLTHPEASLKSLRLLQEEEVRKILIRPDVIARLM
ncbi:Mediator complex, subunit Med31 [Ascosphaera apis ARSEF 7405]|uniref:Mediator of RNA polymerase II transcription subunit 31 n=1 Tax=Ascosphaera apis ARSEF 7405 TaxID=392613 RepID=A0A162II66_9EURO|nr:Mediator complex, subunit Med31 [Ascosphaera apis ARSEF 7405]